MEIKLPFEKLEGMLNLGNRRKRVWFPIDVVDIINAGKRGDFVLGEVHYRGRVFNRGKISVGPFTFMLIQFP